MPWSAIWSRGQEKVGIGNQNRRRGRSADPVTVGLGHPQQRGLNRLVATVENEDLGLALERAFSKLIPSCRDHRPDQAPVTAG